MVKKLVLENIREPENKYVLVTCTTTTTTTTI